MSLQNQRHNLDSQKIFKKVNKRRSVYDKALVVPFEESELIAQPKNAHNIGEEFILPAS